jgi:hypothetical protein
VIAVDFCQLCPGAAQMTGDETKQLSPLLPAKMVNLADINNDVYRGFGRS